MEANGKSILSLYLILPWIGLGFLIVGGGILLMLSMAQRQSARLLRKLKPDD